MIAMSISKKNKVVILGDSGWHEHPWKKSNSSGTYGLKKLTNAYSVFGDYLEDEGMKLYKSHFLWYKNGKFTKGWEYDKGKWKQVFDISPDFIFDKTPLNSKTIKIKKHFSKQGKILNTWFIEHLCSDKWETYKLFPHLVPKCYLVNGIVELKKAIKKIKSDKVVIKPRYGSSAKGLYIIDKTERVPNVKGEYIVQEFVDTCSGIPNLVKGVYDIRLLIVDGVVNHAYMRVAQKGLVSNVALGAKVTFLDTKEIPKKILKSAKSISIKLKKYKPSLYTADFVMDGKGKVHLIELNSKPFFCFYDDYGRQDLKEKLLRSIAKSIK